MLLRTLRQFAAVICRELAEQFTGRFEEQPGRLFFPKHVHELGSLEPEAPDGLSLEYIRIAVARNTAAWNDAKVDTAVITLATHISRQVSCAALIERSLLERLK